MPIINQPKNKSKKYYLIFALIFVLMAASATLYFFVYYKRSDTSPKAFVSKLDRNTKTMQTITNLKDPSQKEKYLRVLDDSIRIIENAQKQIR